MFSKLCSTCRLEKPAIDFYSDKRRKDGLFSRCKECHNKTVAAYATKNIERKRETNRIWQEANPEKRRDSFQRRYSRTDAVVPEAKCCSHCGLYLSVSEFHRKKDSPDGLYPKCKSCRREGDTALRAKNIDSRREYDRNRYRADPNRRDQKDKYLANREQSLAKSAAYAKANPEIVRAAKKRYVATHGHYSRRLKKAAVQWADMEKILLFYIERDRLTAETGILHHVDHIVPIKSAIVCGLHNEFNLQVITKIGNLSKGNRTWPDMP